ncbi:MAG: hypothetical protein QF535_12575, partial [Anaerolineales bacterium]|nr:hypothetical protein [Anaerolineales bacterium]
DVSNAFVIDRSSGNVGIGTTAPDGELHVHTATAGSVTGHANADDLVVENSDHGGITILTPNDKSGVIYFGAPASNVEAQLYYDHNGQEMKLGTNDSSGYLVFATDSNTEAMRIDSSQNILFQTANQKISGSSTSTGSFGMVGVGVASPSSNVHIKGSNTPVKLIVEQTTSGEQAILSLNTTNRPWGLIADQSPDILSIGEIGASVGSQMHFSNAGNVGIGTASPDQTLHIHKGSAGSIGSDGNAVLTVENADTSVIQMLSPRANNNYLMFGNPTDGFNDGWIRYQHGSGTGQFDIKVNGTEAMRIDSSGRVGIGVSSPQTKIMGSDNETNNTAKEWQISSMQYASTSEPEGWCAIQMYS